MNFAIRIPHSAFTLIELLVVVTIIVVLLALLIPALDKAIYQTDLAVCAATQRSLGAGIVQYAFDNKRWYPHRPGNDGSQFSNHRILSQPFTSYSGIGPVVGPFDQRPYLRGYVDINKHFRDPFLPDLPLDDPDTTVWIYGSYYLFYGWQYNGEHGMYKMGDLVEFSPTPGHTDRYDLLTGDYDEVIPSSGNVYASHPDRGTEVLWRQKVIRGIEPVGITTHARWTSFNTVLRGPWT